MAEFTDHITNFYELNEVKKFNKTYYNPNSDAIGGIKHPFRIGVIGASGSGKTNILINLLQRTSGTFQNIIVVHKLDETFYDYLEDKINPKTTNKNEQKKIEFFKKLSDVPGRQIRGGIKRYVR